MNYEDRVTKEYVEGLMAGMPKIETGSYVGTGEFGREHPCSLTFDELPALLLIVEEDSPFRAAVLLTPRALGTDINEYGGLTLSGTARCISAWRTGNTVYWYSPDMTQGDRQQANMAGKTYRWYAFV